MRKHKLLLLLPILASPAVANAALLSEALEAAGSFVLLNLLQIAMLIAAAVLTVVMIAIPIVADFALTLAAVFAPIGLALWPISKNYATSALNMMIGSALVGSAAAFFIKLIAADGGVIDQAVRAAIAQMQAGTNQIGVVVGVAVGMIVLFGIFFLIATAIPRIMTALFGGIAIDPAGLVKAGAAMAMGGAVGGAIGAAGGARAGVSAASGKSGGAAAAAVAGGIGRGVAGGAIRGMAASSRGATNLVNMASAGGGGGGKAARPAPRPPAPRPAQNKDYGKDGGTGI